MSDAFMFPVVWVRWIDSALRHGQCSMDELADFEPVPMESVGWLIRDTPDHIVVALEIFPGEREVRSACVIPRSCIVDARKIMDPAEWYAPDRNNHAAEDMEAAGLCWHAAPGEKFCGRVRRVHEAAGLGHEFLSCREWAAANPQMFSSTVVGTAERTNAER